MTCGSWVMSGPAEYPDQPSVFAVAPGARLALRKGCRPLGRIVGHLLQADAAGAGPTVLDLDGADHEHLALVAAPAATRQGSFLPRQTISVSSTSTSIREAALQAGKV